MPITIVIIIIRRTFGPDVPDRVTESALLKALSFISGERIKVEMP